MDSSSTRATQIWLSQDVIFSTNSNCNKLQRLFKSRHALEIWNFWPSSNLKRVPIHHRFNRTKAVNMEQDLVSKLTMRPTWSSSKHHLLVEAMQTYIFLLYRDLKSNYREEPCYFRHKTIWTTVVWIDPENNNNIRSLSRELLLSVGV